MLRYKKIMRLSVILHFVISLVEYLFIASNNIVTHFDVSVPTATGNKAILFLFPLITFVLSEILIRLASVQRVKEGMESIEAILYREGYYIGGQYLAVAIFVLLSFDQIDITNIFV